MPFSHYPKTVGNIVLAWVHPSSPDVPPADGMPDFLGLPFSELNLARGPLGPGTVATGYHDAQPFTRFYGSIACDQRLDVCLSFSNDEVDVLGRPVTDESLPTLNYDALGARVLYDPTRQEQVGKFFTMIFGRWLRVEVKNVGEAETARVRLYVRGSVF